MLAALSVMVLALLTPGYDAFRLPTAVVPKEYDLRILTDLTDFKFEGRVDILVECKNITRNITLHAKDLDIVESNVAVESLEGIKNLVTTQGFDKEYDYYVLHLAEPLQVGHKYNVSIPFSGNLTEGLAGYYRSSYVDRATNEIRWLAVTQFESMDARRAFPCFDEPEFKAQFRMVLGHHKNFSGVSNMPLNYTEPMEDRVDWVWDHFLLSERMSTYLLAFMVSDLEYRVSPPSGNNVTFRIWARHDALPQTMFAGDIGPKVLRFYEEYFDVPYPLPKQDMAAIPDFSAGAMENWGLVTYRETTLLYDDNVTTESSKKNIAGVIAHELAHQWFGNLVTMKWWSDLWLNEGFATYISTVGVHKLHPEWKVDESDAVNGLLTVFSFDALTSSHPVFVTIDHPSKIGQIFDTISYKKGAYLLRMMNMFLGQTVFKRGVSQYLKAHKFANAEQDDLWKSLTRAAHEDKVLPEYMTVKQIMDTWTIQTGYPVVTVIRDYEKGIAKISQKRYLAHMLEDSAPLNQSCWVLPVTYTTQVEGNFESTTPNSWFLCNSSDTETPEHQISGLPTADQWVILNIKALGPFRVNYDDRNWELISRTLNSDRFTSIGLLNRVQLLVDSMDLAWTGALDYSKALRLVDYLQHETEYLPWHTGFSSFRVLSRLLRRTQAYGHYRNYVRHLLTPIYNKIGNISHVEGKEDLQQAKLRNLVVSGACNLQLGNCEEQARHLFQKWRSTTNPDIDNPIPRDMRSTVNCIAVKYGGEKEWNFIWERYLASNVGTEKNALLDTLSCTRERWLLSRFLHWSLNETGGIRKQDSGFVFSGVARNDVGYDVAKEFFFDELEHIYNYLGAKSGRLGRYVSVLADHIYTQREYDQLAQLTKDNEKYFKQSSLSVKQALEKARSNIQWHKNHYQPLLKSIASY